MKDMHGEAGIITVKNKAIKMITAAFTAAVVLVGLAVSGCGSIFGGDSDPVKIVKSYAGVDLTGCTALTNIDDHGGFLGDGETLITFDCSEKDEEVSSAVENWSHIPLSENLQLMIYGGVKDEIRYGVSEIRSLIPEVTDGRYYFCDRYALENEKNFDPFSDERLFERYSYNFTLAIYDYSSCIFYFYMLDT